VTCLIRYDTTAVGFCVSVTIAGVFYSPNLSLQFLLFSHCGIMGRGQIRMGKSCFSLLSRISGRCWLTGLLNLATESERKRCGWHPSANNKSFYDAGLVATYTCLLYWHCMNYLYTATEVVPLPSFE